MSPCIVRSSALGSNKVYKVDEVYKVDKVDKVTSTFGGVQLRRDVIPVTP